MTKNKLEENLLCLITGIVMAIAFVAIACGDGNKGISDLF